MNQNPYRDWINIYNEQFAEVWQKENKDLRRASMLLFALKKEFCDVQVSLDNQIQLMRLEVQKRDSLHMQTKSEGFVSSERLENSTNKENTDSLNIYGTASSTRLIEESPDVFRNLNNSNSTTISSIADGFIDTDLNDTTYISTSPTIKKKKRSYYNKGKESPSFCFLSDGKPLGKVDSRTPTMTGKATHVFKTPVLLSCGDNEDIFDSSVIENTPEVRPKKSRSVKSKILTSRKKSGLSLNLNKKNATLTQLFYKSEENPRTKPIIRSLCDDSNLDITSVDDSTQDTANMGLTEIIEYINKVDDTTMLSASNASCSKILDETNYEVLEAVHEPTFVPQPIARGHERKQLAGWSCEECKKFYECQNLTDEEIKQKMNECSRHRSKFKPQDDTFTGFWDLTIPTQENN